MKNKKLLYLLIPCTLLLWGMVVYKIFSVVSSDDDHVAFRGAEFTESTTDKTLSDTFSINPTTYRDPFLGTIKKNNNIITNRNAATIKIDKPTTGSIVTLFPKITYGGVIKNNKSKKQLALVLINGQSCIMKIGDIMSDVELIKVFRDSIEVKYFKESRFILKQ